MVFAPSFRALVPLCFGLAMVVSSGGLRCAFAESAQWSSEVVQLMPADPTAKRPVVVSLALDFSGRRLAIAGDDHAIRIWDLGERRVLQRLVGHTGWVRSLAYSGDGSQLASAGGDGRILIWSESASQPLRELMRGDEALSAIAFRPGTSQLASVGFHEPLRFFDTTTGAQLTELDCPCIDMRAIAFTPDGGLMAGGGRNGKIRIWDPETGETQSTHAAHRQRIRAVAFSPDGNWLASCGEDRRVRIASLDGNSEFTLPPAAAKVMAVEFLGAQRLAVGGSDNLIRIWDLESRQEVDRLTGHTGSVMALAFRGGTLVSAGFDATVRVWRAELNAGIEVRTPASQAGRLESFEVR